jgi:aspartate/methionine/tyrosine aminotransferase
LQEQLLRNLPRWYLECETASQQAVEEEFTEAFFEIAGQPSAHAACLSLHYSASVSIAVTAKQLRDRGGRVLVMHPTFDNIPALLSHYHVPMSPISVAEVAALDRELPGDVSALFLVVPNNPTGESIDPDALRRVAQRCAREGVLLLIDFRFRFLSELHAWDQYEVLLDSGVDFLCVEDTGKTWPMLDMKVGMLVASPSLRTPVREITEDYLLNVSPFVLKLLTEYIRSDPERSWLEIVDANRARLREALLDTGAELVDARAAQSIAWVRLPDGWDGDDFCRWTSDRGVALCPGGPFYWHEPERGAGFVRIALLRPTHYFAAAAAHLSALMEVYASTEAVPA